MLQLSDNGWITGAIFFAWLRDPFIPSTKDVRKPLVLLVDGHASHKGLDTSQLCEDNGIILYCLLQNSSHLTQPLDQAFFGSIKAAWGVAANRFIAETGDPAGLDTFEKVLKPVWTGAHSAATILNATQSF